jgi:formylglycine-generating enzyme required for sulfatase activity
MSERSALVENLFMSYRREDTMDVAGRIDDRLWQRFGRAHVFKDVDSLPLGMDFRQYLRAEVGKCGVMLVVIGRQWVPILQQRSRSQADDYVRIEVAEGLRRGIPVIPLLVQGATMPKREELPDDLKDLAARHGTDLRSDPHFHPDMTQLLDRLAPLLGAPAQPAAPSMPPASSPQREWDDIVLPARLDQFGFEGRRYRKTGVACIVPPVRPVAEGKFIMGSAQDDPAAYDNEKPQYSIPVGAFEIGQYPVTVAEYALYLAANPSVATPLDYAIPANATWSAPAWRGKTLTWVIQQQQRADHPVVCVTWENARDYCRWLAQVTGQAWRLPTEAEWEKAARWDTRATPPHARIYPWGDQWDKARANTSDGGPGMTTPIGAYASKGDASPYGCHDMAGNVWEWTSTAWYDNPPYDATKYENDSDTMRVLRGGSWRLDPQIARAARRDWSQIDISNDDNGFRLVLARVGAGSL